MRSTLQLFLSAAILILIAGSSFSQESGTVTVGSKTFTESRVLAEAIAQLIEARTDLKVERRIGLGGTMVVFSALREGEVDIYPDYTGTAWSVVLKREERAPDPLKTYLTVKREFEEKYGITWLDPFGFSNSYAVAVRTPVAKRLGLSTISDLNNHAGELSAGWSLEFLNREDGLPGLMSHYGLSLSSSRGMEHGLAYEAIRSGEIDLIDAYTTDGKLLKYDLTLLEDDRRFFPPYEGAPLVRMATLERHPELRGILNELAFKLPAEKMQRLNYEVEEKGRPFADVARSFLVDEGLISEDGSAPKGEAIGGGSLGEFVVARIPVTLRLIGEHLFLTGAAVLLAILIAVPLGIYLTGNEKLSGWVIGMTGVIQTIPSLALLAFMIPIPWLGLSMRSAIAALFLYALLPIVRNTFTGISEVDADLVEAARGMGLEDRQILRHVQIPLAVPTIMAGVRTAAVISVGVATLAAFIGAGGLGEPILTGLELNEPRLIMAGAVPAALLALAVDGSLGLVERFLSPAR
ncbi:MAG: ABC transporter permease subunit [Acidobacteria bacterium]|nr:MAG: ABC transporter permease subunit [Acidobacteriota bacterium]REJ98680.1 MAG: ABC transporter permease subunit [Acidobacteriota bacterium]REK16664.1 MAG: ABC transporter permease subunit [Acidobacteriota bacterium]REK42575.1 MAG: ABC transporter permease subunit [Acidobacteriota bacterium]